MLLSTSLLLAALAAPVLAADPEARLHEIALLAERDNAQARTLLVQEGPALIAGAPYALRIDYLRLLRRVQLDGGNVRAAEATNGQIAKLAEAEGDQPGIALAALAQLERFLERHRERQRARQRDDADPAGALVELEALAARYRGLNSLEFDAGCEVLHGLAYDALGQYDQALRHQLRALEIVQRHPGLWSPRGADIRLGLARTYLNMGDPGKALATVRAQRKPGQARSAPVPRIAASLSLIEGQAMVALNDVDGALGAYEAALSLARAGKLAALEAQVQAHTAAAYLKLGRYRQAETAARAARAALAAAGAGDDQPLLRVTEAHLGLALFGQGQEQAGLGQVDAAAAALRAAGAMAPLARLLAEKGAVLERAGRYREALAAQRERETVADALALGERRKVVAALQDQFNARERVARGDIARREKAVQEADADNRGLRLLAAVLGVALALLAGAVAFVLYKKSLRTRRRLGELNAELAYRSARDPLTGLYNRRSFQERMRSRTGEAAARADATDCFTLLDIDHFKRINDEYGHAAGDAVLVEVGRRLRQATRESDMVLRWGGEEFLVYAQGVTPPQRPLLVRRMLDAIAATPVLLDDGTALQVSATAGAVSLPFEHETEGRVDWEQAIALADRALYKGKEAGRNRGYLVAGLRHPGDGPQEGLQLDLILPGVPA